VRGNAQTERGKKATKRDYSRIGRRSHDSTRGILRPRVEVKRGKGRGLMQFRASPLNAVRGIWDIYLGSSQNPSGTEESLLQRSLLESNSSR